MALKKIIDYEVEMYRKTLSKFNPDLLKFIDKELGVTAIRRQLEKDLSL